MAAQRQGGERTDGQHATGKTLKRRGILAAAGAVVAGIVAKQTSQSVAANDAVWTFPYTGTTTTPDHGSAISITNLGNASDGILVQASRVGLSGAGGAVGVQGSGSGTTDNTSGAGVIGVGGDPDGDGMRGTGAGIGTGVSGTSASGTGLFGQSSGNSVSKGIYGKHTTNGYAVYGEALAGGGYGVTGVALDQFGVLGQSDSGTAVQGQVLASKIGGGANIAANTIAVKGLNQSTGTGGIGVQGISTTGLGASLQGGHAPLLLVPGAVAAANLAASGHQAGELYVTSDDRLMFFTGVAWREVAFVPPNATPQAQPAGAIQQPAPAPLPPKQSTGGAAGNPNPLPARRP